MRALYRIARPVLFALPPELAHHATSALLAAVGRGPRGQEALATLAGPRPEPAGGPGSRFGVDVLGCSFPSVLGIAGGFDKEGVLVDALAALGFGHVEVGTATPRPQPGNPRPRLFRLPADDALVNRLGFPSGGVVAMRRHLECRRRSRPVVVGVSLGKNKETPPERAGDDYRAGFEALADLADFVTVNVSSPNTPGLRDLGVGRALAEVLGAVRAAADGYERGGGRRVPVLLKLSPDLADADLDDAVARALDLGVAGFVAVNTTVRRDGLRSAGVERIGAGGLSGAPLRARALEVVRRVHRRAGVRVPVVGVGGVFTGRDAFALLAAGATLVQTYTGFVYRGPTFARDVHRELAAELDRHGHASAGAAVGSEAS